MFILMDIVTSKCQIAHLYLYCLLLVSMYSQILITTIQKNNIYFLNIDQQRIFNLENVAARQNRL